MSGSGAEAVDWRAVAAASTDGVGVVDGGTVVHADEQLVASFGYGDAGSLVGRPWRELYPPPERDRIEREVLGVVDRDGAWRGDATGLRADGTTFPQELSVRRLDDDTLAWAVRDATEREERERELARYESIVETVTDSVYALDQDLQFSFVNSALCEMVGTSREALLGTDVRTLFEAEAEAEMAADVRQRVVAGDTNTGSLQATLSTPDGDRSIETRYRLHPEPDGEYRGSVGVIRDVTEREERERELERRRDELATLDRINELLLETTQELVGTTSRAAVERTVCERLADSELYRFAWTGARELDGDRVVPRVAAGEDDGYLEAVTADESAAKPELAARAMETGAVQTATVESEESEHWRAELSSRGIRSVVAVPLRYRETVYGVLAVYATRADAFSGREQHGFGVLGETVGFAINAIKRRQLLFADTVTELELRVTAADAPLFGLSADSGCRLTLDGYVSAGDRWVLYLDVTDGPVDRIAAAAADAPAVERARTVGGDGGDSRLELVVTEPSLLHVVTAAGGTVRAATLEGGVGHVTVDVPVAGDVHDVVEHLDTALSDWELLARHEEDRTPERVQALGGLLDDLTDRQREALEAAFRAGYFDWPRASTAEEVAEALDVAPPTLHGHLRKAERAVFAGLFD